ncbi:MAG: hypothetical protein U5M23_10865 [Marinagarivorans sp.]|nr:hypothetical protein [Marinagarivorans sp.]
MQLRGYFLGRSSHPWALYKRSRRLNAPKTTTQLHFLYEIDRMLNSYKKTALQIFIQPALTLCAHFFEGVTNRITSTENTKRQHFIA